MDDSSPFWSKKETLIGLGIGTALTFIGQYLYK